MSLASLALRLLRPARWIINDTASYRPELVPATDFDNSTLISTQKARGIGDCWDSEWAWC